MSLGNKHKVILLSSILLCLSSFIGWIFWKQEIQYSLPTPVPANFIDVKVGEHVDLTSDLAIEPGRAVLLHFFNSDCPCSRFNMQEFERLAHQYKNQVQLFVIVQSDDPGSVKEFKDKYELNVPVILDNAGLIAKKCGVYATPQAALLDLNGALYFKGNYNKARFCTQRETRFAEIAIDHLLKKEPLPLFMQYALSDSYGCSLPSDENYNKKQSSFNLF